MAMIARISYKIEDFFAKKGLIEPSFYIDQRYVLEELKRRQSLFQDDSKILEIIKPTPSIQRLLEKPHLIFFRQVATPIHETLRVIEIAKQLELDFCILEYSTDKFVVANNKYKYDLAILPIFKKLDKNGDDVFFRKTIVDINENVGNSLNEVKTLKRDRLIDFHHEMFTYVTGLKIEDVVIDISDWLLQFDGKASKYYEPFFHLFLKHNVLAEVFLQDKYDGGGFTHRVIEPAFANVCFESETYPLILNYLPKSEQVRQYWDCYPISVDEFLIQKGYSN